MPKCAYCNAPADPASLLDKPPSTWDWESWAEQLSGEYPHEFECEWVRTHAFTLPEDFETCGTCGFDHDYEQYEAQEWHAAND